MEKNLLEVCVDSFASARAACNAGADRLELCANLVIGGTTPSDVLLTQILQAFSVPVNVLIRPRFGDFLYTEEEFAQMEQEIRRVCQLGANGVVIGALLPSGELDMAHLRRLCRAAEGKEITLHRAFDMARDLPAAMEQAIDLGITTILTSGGCESAVAGKEILKRLQHQAAGRIRLMAGAGVHADNIQELFCATGITAYHGSCRKGNLESAMVYRNEKVNMGLPGFSEYTKMQTDPEEVAKCVQAVRSLTQNS